MTCNRVSPFRFEVSGVRCKCKKGMQGLCTNNCQDTSYDNVENFSFANNNSHSHKCNYLMYNTGISENTQSCIRCNKGLIGKQIQFEYTPVYELLSKYGNGCGKNNCNVHR
jgi:hypothetical protein